MLKTYTIATGNEFTSKAAAQILDDGGNAYDAILAALFMSFVSEPLLSSPGGGGYLLAQSNTNKAQVFDFFAQTPFNKDVVNKDFYPIIGNFGATQQEFHIGMSSIATPGIPAGIFAIHNQLGSMALAQIAEPAIKKAREGIEVNAIGAEVIKILNPILTSSCHANALFSNQQKQLLKEGEILRNKHLAAFLEGLANNPMDWFYFDTPAYDIVNDMKHNNGLLTIKDFENYEVCMREPLSLELNKWKILTNAQPTTGGKLITEQLKHAFNSCASSTNQKIIEAMIYADKFKNQEAFESSKGTTHMSVIDANNNVACMTVSNGEGSGYVVPNSGFMLNNFLGEEDINTKGFFNFEENTRMASMMSPTILSNSTDKIALGTGGSNRIKTALFQVIWHIVVDKQTLDQAINTARFHFENGVLDIEHGINKEEIAGLDLSFDDTVSWVHRSLYFGGVNVVQHGTKSSAIGDSRRNGFGIVKSYC